TGSVDRPPGLLSIDDLLLADPDRKDLRPGGEPAEAHSGLGAGGDDARDSGPVSDAVEGAVTSAVEEVSAAKDPPGQLRVGVIHAGIDDGDDDAGAGSEWTQPVGHVPRLGPRHPGDRTGGRGTTATGRRRVALSDDGRAHQRGCRRLADNAGREGDRGEGARESQPSGAAGHRASEYCSLRHRMLSVTVVLWGPPRRPPAGGIAVSTTIVILARPCRLYAMRMACPVGRGRP